jgi:hypothetical protein
MFNVPEVQRKRIGEDGGNRAIRHREIYMVLLLYS